MSFVFRWVQGLRMLRMGGQGLLLMLAIYAGNEAPTVIKRSLLVFLNVGTSWKIE